MMGSAAGARLAQSRRGKVGIHRSVLLLAASVFLLGLLCSGAADARGKKVFKPQIPRKTVLKPAVVGHGFSGASIPGFSHRRVSTPPRVVKEPVSMLPDPSYYTDLEPEPPVKPRTLAYANLFDDTEDKYYTTQGAFSIASLAASDYPLVLFAFEVSEYLGSKPADAPASSTDYATAFRVTLTVYKAANKTADVGTPLTVGLWFEEGETRKSVRVGYLDDEDGTEKFLDFTKTSAPEAPFSKSPQSLTVRVDSAGSAVIHVAAVAGSISSPPIAVVVDRDSHAIFLGYPDEHVMSVQLSNPASYVARDGGKSALLSVEDAKAISETIGEIAAVANDAFASALVKSVEASKFRLVRRLGRRGIEQMDPMDAFGTILEEASRHELAERDMEQRESRRRATELKWRLARRDHSAKDAVRPPSSEPWGRRLLPRWSKKKFSKAASSIGGAVKSGADAVSSGVTRGAHAVSDTASNAAAEAKASTDKAAAKVKAAADWAAAEAETTTERVAAEAKALAAAAAKASAPLIKTGVKLGSDFVKDPVSGVNYALSVGADNLSPVLRRYLPGVKTAFFVAAGDFKEIAAKVKGDFEYGVAKMDKGFAIFVKVVDQMYASTVRSFQQAYKAVEGVLINALKEIDRVLDYIKTFLLNALKAIFHNAKIIQSYTEKAPRFASKGIERGGEIVEKHLDKVAETIEKSMKSGAKKISKTIGNLKLDFPTEFDAFKGLASTASYVMHQVLRGIQAVLQLVMGGVEKLLHAALGKHSKVIQEILSNLPCADQMADLAGALEKAFSNIGDISKTIATFSELIGTAGASILTCAGDIVNGLAEDVFAPIFDMIGHLFKMKVKIPGLSDLWKLVTGMDLSFSSVIGTIGSLIYSVASMAGTVGKIVPLGSMPESEALAAEMYVMEPSRRLDLRATKPDDRTKTWMKGYGVAGVLKSTFGIVNSIILGFQAKIGKEPFPEMVMAFIEFLVTSVSVPLAAIVGSPGEPITVSAFAYWIWHLFSVVQDGVLIGDKRPDMKQDWNNINMAVHVMLSGGSICLLVNEMTSLEPMDASFIMVETTAQLLNSMRILDDITEPTDLTRLSQAVGAVLEITVGGYEMSQAAMMLEKAEKE